MVAILVILTVVGFLTIDYLWFRRRGRTAITAMELPDGAAPLAASRRAPLGVYFAPGHSWVFLEPSGIAKLGIDDFARSVVGDVECLERRCVGETVHKGDIILRTRHGERSVTFRSPIDGVIESVNRNELTVPGTNEVEPYTSSWIYEIKPDETSEIPKSMLIGEAAREWLGREMQRLKVFLATITPQHDLVGQTLQDGGMPQWGLIDSLGDDDWHKLEEKFFG